MESVLTVLLAALVGLKPFALALLGLIVLDVLLGVALAIRMKVFKFDRLAEFYTTMVIPYLIGWLAISLLVKLIVDPSILGGYGYLLSDSVVGLAWTAVVLSLGKSIYDNAAELYGDLNPFKPPYTERIEEPRGED
jgi:ABC-type sugar transport system permease subunit